MARHEGVMFAFVRLWKTGQTSELAQRRKQLLPPCQGLVDIALVAYVEHQPVTGSVEYPVNGHCQFHSPQV